MGINSGFKGLINVTGKLTVSEELSKISTNTAQGNTSAVPRFLHYKLGHLKTSTKCKVQGDVQRTKEVAPTLQ